jgi:hypothetical protein
VSNLTRLSYIRSLLNSIGNIQLLRVPYLSDQIFELYCYFRKLDEFVMRRKTPQCISNRAGFFSPHAKPGHPRSADYFILSDPSGGEDRDLILNGEFPGISGVNHSPDIVLAKSGTNEVISIYECKNYSGRLGRGVYREFIGYCKEMGLLSKANQMRINALIGTFPEMAPCIYTSGIASQIQVQKMKKTYNFTVSDSF